MDIIVTSTQRVFRRVDDCTALLLMEAFPESFKKYAAPAPPPPSTVPVFYVGVSEYTGNIGLFVKLPTGEMRSAFQVLDKKQVETALGVGIVPQSVWDVYEAKLKAEQELARSVASQGTTYR